MTLNQEEVRSHLDLEALSPTAHWKWEGEGIRKVGFSKKEREKPAAGGGGMSLRWGGGMSDKGIGNSSKKGERSNAAEGEGEVSKASKPKLEW